jgi:hypothetical protein
MHTSIWSDDLKRRYHFGELGENGRIILMGVSD